MHDLNDPARISELRKLIDQKGFLRKYYEEIYSKFKESFDQTPLGSASLELGSGGGFIKDFLPEITSSDVLPYEGIDRVVDGRQMPFADQSLRFICMLNVFHHIPDVEVFLREASRCLVPGGRLFISDQHVGKISRVVFERGHHEPFDPSQTEWKFESSGPLSGANGALLWIVFQRDRKKFEVLFPQFQLIRYTPHTPLRYWLAGGLKNWSLAPAWAFPFLSGLDRNLASLSADLASFADVELVKL